MNHTQHTHANARRIISLALAAQMVFSAPLHAASVALASAPLVNSTTSSVLPNLMFVMDTSGSMEFDFTPDWVTKDNLRSAPWTFNGGTGGDDNRWDKPYAREKNCKDSADDEGTIEPGLDKMDMCTVGDVPYMSSAINSQYYNPAIRYLPGANADGSSKPSQTDPTQVLLDGYGKHLKTQLGEESTATTATINLTTQHPDRVWCTTKTPSDAERTNATASSAVCRINSAYLYPDATYKYGRDNDETTSNKNVHGKYGAPYYYSTVVTEHCKEAELKNCTSSSTATGEYTFPAKARWCSDTGLTSCQSIKTSTYKYPRYPGVSTSGTAATGTITLDGDSKNYKVYGIKVNGVEILGATVFITTNKDADLAAALASQINKYASNPDYTATVSDKTITLTSTIAAGATANGSITYNSDPDPGKMFTGTLVTGGSGASSVPPYTFARTDIIAPVSGDVGSYPKDPARTDCAGSTCTYAEEITNFGNWYAYYRTRMQAMKSAVSNAFKPVGSNYRVGFVNIFKGNYLPIAQFTLGVGSKAAKGQITITHSINRTLSSLKVNDVEILGGSVSNGSTSNLDGFAASIADQINAYKSEPEFSATVSGTVITLESTIVDGANANGDITFTSTIGMNNGPMIEPVSPSPHISGGVSKGQKTAWYDKLFDANASGGTPLRMALGAVGRMYAGKEFSSAGSTSGTAIDPVQYSCQKNFALLTTDGYWNQGNNDTPNDGKGLDLSGNLMGNLDSDPKLRRSGIYEGPTASSGSLADVAKYYYDTDLRTTALGNCAGGLTDVKVCEESGTTFTNQRMTSYTLGLGVDGTLPYIKEYATAKSGAFYDIKEGLNATDWPVPEGNTETAVDDLWHAAVNGGGAYFSAKDPAQLSAGLNAALASINTTVGAASAAATSTLNPVAGNNYAYVASYTTGTWKGNLEARSINITTGVVSETATWCVESIPQGVCASPKKIVADGSGSSTIYNCVESGATASTCAADGGVFDTTATPSICKVEMTNSCTGTLPSKVFATYDTRNIHMNRSGTLVPFAYDADNSPYFNGAGLSQWSVLTSEQKTLATGANLVKFLRGQTGFEDRSSNTDLNRVYRYREATLGDALESQPFFISKPVFSYADPGYATFKGAQASRAGTVYMGTNDGMLHAFNADDGFERWAYVPSAVIPNMWKLADKNYASGHTNYVNGSPIISDICIANCANADATVGAQPVWRTILVGGLNGGGRSYYALDITAPTNPTLLWEIASTSSGFSNLGFSYGQPVITKKTDGTWVVLFTSGYNNTAPGDGKGTLFVVDAATGTKISAYDTGVGDTTTPSGLAKVTAWNEYQGINNTAGYVYGGDLLGNIWRFDINTSDTEAPFLFATLKDPGGSAQPVTTAPVLGEIKAKRIIFIGTGKYLEASDLTNTSVQTVYAIKDDNAAATLTNARSVLVAQTMSMADAASTLRTSSKNAVDFSSGRGWYVDLGAKIGTATAATFVGERVNVDMQLVQGTLLVPSIVPANTICSPGGEGWLSFFDYETGGYVDVGTTSTTVSQRYSSPIVGVNVIYIGGKPIVEVVTASKPTPEIDDNVLIAASAGGFSSKRVIWRELLP